MRIRQGWSAGLWLGLAMGVVGCKASSVADGQPLDSKDAGRETSGGGGNGVGDGDASDQLPPDFNFIPANDGKCDVVGNRDLRPVARRALMAIADYPAQVATDLELCPTVQGERACAPCASHPFLDWVNAVDAADAAQLAQNPDRMPLSEYIRRALQFPYRELVLLDIQGDQGVFALAQGRTACAEPGGCRELTLQPESMEKDCVSLTQWLPLAGMETSEAWTLTSSGEGDKPFGFVVPLTASLPTYPLANATEVSDSIPNACPTATQVTSDEEFQSFLACNPSLTLQLTTPKLTRLVDGEGLRCMQLSGLIAVNTLPAAARGLVDTFEYEDPDAPGFIRVVLAARLADAEVSVEPSLLPEAAP